jgi:hypothetical protein
MALASRRWLTDRYAGKIWVWWALALSAAACSSAMNMPAAARPERIADLETRSSRNPVEVAALTRRVLVRQGTDIDLARSDPGASLNFGRRR